MNRIKKALRYHLLFRFEYYLGIVERKLKDMGSNVKKGYLRRKYRMQEINEGH